MNENAGPDFWAEGARMRETAVAWCDHPATAGTARQLLGNDLPEFRRYNAQQAERCRRTAAAMRGGTP
jgi:hypothetical protein